MLPGDRLVVAFVRPAAVSHEFKEWPLHVTIVPWFRLPDSSEQITRGLAKALMSIQPFEALAGEPAMFGPRKNRPAVLIKLPTPFSDIEQQVRNYLHKKRAWLVDETTKRHYSFRPHVTVQSSDHIEPGERFMCKELYIVEQKGTHKEIVQTILL